MLGKASVNSPGKCCWFSDEQSLQVIAPPRTFVLTAVEAALAPQPHFAVATAVLGQEASLRLVEVGANRKHRMSRNGRSTPWWSLQEAFLQLARPVNRGCIGHLDSRPYRNISCTLRPNTICLSFEPPLCELKGSPVDENDGAGEMVWSKRQRGPE